MINLSDYQITEQLHVGAKTVVYRGLRLIDNQPVILKILKQNYPSLDEIATLEHEYQLLKNLKLPDTIKAFDLIRYQNRLILVLEDVKGETLNHLIKQKTMSLEKFFKIALALVNSLEHLHKNKIIHKDIKPSNIIINPENDNVYLIDFSIASILMDHVSANSNINRLEGTLAYMSPEQTGRMDISLDQRTDLYSLGVVFYEMLTGQRPFIHDDTLELVYAHLAKQAAPLHAVKKEIPEQLSHIVLKLLSKDPNQRYNSAAGLKYDLNECALQWFQFSRIITFPLGRHDDQSELKISHQLYGRQQQIEQLLALFNEITFPPHHSACVLISGEAGVGKTALVQALQKTIMGSKGYLVTGKFEQLQQNVPYHGLIQALKILIKQIATQPEEILIPLKKKIAEGVGNLGQIIIDIIPEVEWLIGRQPSVPILSPVETSNRFIMAFQNFMAALIQPGKPLVIFLDDLQWADHATFNFLEFILTDARIKNLFIIGAYRSKEVKEDHSLNVFKNGAKGHQIYLQEIALQSLEENDINQMLQDSLSLNSKEVQPLAKLLYEKTAGNAFFVKKYLQTLNQEMALQYEAAKMKWSWNIRFIERLSIADNVVALITSKIYQLSKQAQETLAFAACIGNKFTLKMLVKVMNKTLQEISGSLIEATRARLIMPLDQAYKYTELFSTSTDSFDIKLKDSSAVFQFSHDKIQQTAYAFLSINDQNKIHFKLGLLFLKKFRAKEQQDFLFETLNHINKGAKFIKTIDDRIQIAELNLLAGQRAKAANASSTATEYLESGLLLLNKNSWTGNYDLMFSLYKELAQSKYFSFRFSEAEDDFHLILEKAKSEIDKATILDMQADLYSNLGKFQDAVKALLQALSLLDIRLPEKFTNLKILWEIIKIKFKIRGNKLLKLSQGFKKLEDEKNILITKLFNHLIYPAYSSDEKTFIYSICKSFSYCLNKGYSMYSLENMLNFAIILHAELKQYEKSLLLTNLVNELNKRCTDKKICAHNEVTIGVFINHWYHHLKTSLKMIEEPIFITKEAGDLHYAAGATAVYGIYLFETGKNISDVLKAVKTAQGFLTRVNSDFRSFNRFMKHVLLFLKGKITNIDKLVHDLKGMTTLENDSTYFVAHSYCSMLLYLTGDYQLAYQIAQEAKKHKNAALSTFPYISFYFYYALILIKLIEKDINEPNKHHLHELRTIAKDFMGFTKQCPDNFSHMSYLINAEIDKLNNKPESASLNYDRAIDAASKHGFLQYVAVANECAAAFYESAKRDTIAAVYFQGAHYAYSRWGAIRKSKALETNYSYLHTPRNINDQFSSKVFTQTEKSVDASSEGTAALDLFSILKSNRAISSELTLNNVLKRLIEIVLENSGASRAALINVRDRNFVIEAEGLLINNQLQISLENNLLLTRNDFPKSLLSYVSNTKQEIISGNIAEHDLFKNDPYILRTQLKSLLCFPIFYKHTISYLLYLENNLLPGAFTSQHSEIISALAAQAAISLENAHLYAAYESFVPYQFLEQLNKTSITDIKLGDQVERTMTILFCDIQGFSSLSESMTPAEVFDFINQFFSFMEPIVRQHQGFIDKYIGDAIMALFTDADQALQTALEMFTKLGEFNTYRAQNHLPPVNIGIGIDTGRVMLGIIGSKDRIETSVLSDTVNNASNIQQLTRNYHVRILLSSGTRNALNHPDDFTMHLVGEARVKGKLHPIEVWELLDNQGIVTFPRQ